MKRPDFFKKKRVIIVDDNYDHASGIRELVGLEANYEVIANAGNANVAISLVKKYRPDIVLMDINMPDTDGITAIMKISDMRLSTRVIALTAYDDPDLIYRAMKVGAKGYILKTMASNQLIHALDEVSQGKIYLPSVLCTRFFDYFHNFEKNQQSKIDADAANHLRELTTREEEVLVLLTQGITYKGVAQKLFISETTVKTHVNNIFQKLQVNDRTQAVLYAIKMGFLNKKAKIA